ncbi:MAG TPA: thioredoxin family protein [Candidatus Hydrogenedentes bacterium]|nr:thioredoxin family protein [Candidatus Hydrogenedentota bacterium]HPU97077.1 thioredoxin family protein [Candidatus Hydrogenedentota bacterium]
MARTESTMMLQLGAKIPVFRLPDTEKVLHGPEDCRKQHGLLVMFICNHCPYVKWVREELARLGRDLQSRDIGVVAIMSNDVSQYPEDAPEQMAIEKATAGYTFPYLYDEDQQAAIAFGAACTPDFFLFDRDLKLYYRGQLDDSRPNSGIPVTGRDLRHAAESMLRGDPPPAVQKPSMGCNIKWRPGSEPAYYRQAGGVAQAK